MLAFCQLGMWHFFQSIWSAICYLSDSNLSPCSISMSSPAHSAAPSITHHSKDGHAVAPVHIHNTWSWVHSVGCSHLTLRLPESKRRWWLMHNWITRKKWKDHLGLKEVSKCFLRIHWPQKNEGRKSFWFLQLPKSFCPWYFGEENKGTELAKGVSDNPDCTI